MNLLKKIPLIVAVSAALVSLPATAQKVEADFDHSSTLLSSTHIPGDMSTLQTRSRSLAFARMLITSCRHEDGRKCPQGAMSR